jgi:hypothetical protein
MAKAPQKVLRPLLDREDRHSPSPSESGLAPLNEIPSRLQEISNELSDLEDAAGSLVQKIMPVLRDMSSDKALGVDNPPSQSALGAQLQDLIFRIGCLTQRMRDASNRVEL